MKIDSNVLDVLGNAEISSNSLKLTGQLDRQLYVAVNKVLELAGGKWNKKALAHLFESDAAEIMDQIILTREIANKKQELGYFPTPPNVVARLLELAEIEPGMLVLEPSAGDGAIAVEVAKRGAIVHCVEIDPTLHNKLASNLLATAPEYSAGLGDFLTVTTIKTLNFRGDLYDCVVMNPPFGKNVAPKHVLHALQFLAPGGRLVAVMPSSVTFRSDSLNDKVRYLAKHIEALPDNSFAASGTNINTVIVTIEN